MTMSIAPPSVRAQTTDPRGAETRPDRTTTTAATRSSSPRDPVAATAQTPRNNEIGFDAKSGLMVVRTVDVGTGDVVAQNPSEAYLRLAQAMIAATRADAVEKSAADIVA